MHLVPHSESILGYPWRQRDTWPHEPCWIGGPKAGDSRPANRKGLKGMMHEVDVTRCYTGSTWACLGGIAPPPPPKATPPHRPMSHPHLMTHNIPHQPSVKIYTNIQPHPRHCTPTARGGGGLRHHPLRTPAPHRHRLPVVHNCCKTPHLDSDVTRAVLDVLVSKTGRLTFSKTGCLRSPKKLEIY